MKKYLEQRIGNYTRIEKIRGEASNRAFFRVYFDKYSLVGMVYPEENPAEIARIDKLTEIYLNSGIQVPKIKEIYDRRILILEDLGDQLVQKAFKTACNEEKRTILQKCAGILERLRLISTQHTHAILDHNRMKWEMDFFLDHFAGNFLPKSTDITDLREKLHTLVEKIENISCFAHRDFHSRNMLYHKKNIYLVDFQDSLVAPPYYDLASFAFDSYLDLKSLRGFLFKEYENRGFPIDHGQLFLTALQRNIKALGTFGFQVHVKKNLSYKKYIHRTIRHILNNKLFGKFFDKSIFIEFFI